jgi:hypothetical protein
MTAIFFLHLRFSDLLYMLISHRTHSDPGELRLSFHSLISVHLNSIVSCALCPVWQHFKYPPFDLSAFHAAASSSRFPAVARTIFCHSCLELFYFIRTVDWLLLFYVYLLVSGVLI